MVNSKSIFPRLDTSTFLTFKQSPGQRQMLAFTRTLRSCTGVFHAAASRAAFLSTSVDAAPAALLETAKGVATITLNQPDNKNALNAAIVDALGDHLATATADAAVRAIVVTNAGNTFCAGADLKSMKAGEKPRHSFVDVLKSIMHCPKPVVGKVWEFDVRVHCCSACGEYAPPP